MKAKQAIKILEGLLPDTEVAFNVVPYWSVEARYPGLTKKQRTEVLNRLQKEREEMQDLKFHVEAVLAGE